MGKLNTRRSATRSVRVEVPEGYSRITLVGTMAFESGGRAPFVHRGPRLVGLSADEVEAIRAEGEPPKVEGEGIKVGVTAGGYATASLVSALSEADGVIPFSLSRLDPDFLDVCDVAIVAQYRSPADFPEAAQAALVAWVRDGGRAMLMHDAVGYRQHPVLFPSVGRGAAIGEKRMLAFRAPDSEVSDDVAVARRGFEHSYYDHITIEVGQAGKVLASEVERNADGSPLGGASGVEGGAPVVVAGPVGKGKVVLNGMVTGLAEGDREVAPVGGEREVLVRCVKWLAEG